MRPPLLSAALVLTVATRAQERHSGEGRDVRAFDSGDRIHPNDAGKAAMAETIDTSGLAR